MSDIFLSYSSQDRSRVETLAHALEAQGFSVWWDHDIPPGTTWDKVIEAALEEAKCVVVVWTGASVESDWVRNEAGEGRKRQNLIPVLFEPVEIPLAFRRVQTLSLTDWEGTVPHDGFARLVQGIARMLGQPEKARAATKLAPTKKRNTTILWLVLPTLFVVIAAIASMNIPMATFIHVDLTTNRLEFTTNNVEGGQYLTDDLKPKWLTLQRFSHISLGVKTLKVADPSEYEFKTDQFKESAWREVQGLGSTMTLTSTQPEDSTVTFESAVKGTRPIIGTLDAIRAISDSKVNMAVGVGQDASLVVKVKGSNTQLAFTPQGETQLILDQVGIEGVQLPTFAKSEESLTVRAALRGDAPSFDIQSHDAGLQLILGFAADRKVKLFSKGTLLVRGLEFFEQGKDGSPVSPERLRGSVKFDGQGDDFKPVEFGAPDYLYFDEKDEFEIKLLELDTARNTLHMVFEGEASKVKTGTATRAVDHRLTLFDKAKHHPYLMALLGIVLWVFPTTISVMHLLKNNKKK